MRTTLFARLLAWLRRKAMPPALTGTTAGLMDSLRRRSEPTAFDLLAELRNTAWACVSINASVCASSPPRLFVRTRPGEPAPRCLTRPPAAKTLHHLRSAPHLELWARGAGHIEEVVEHPLLTLLAQ